mgnify:CR=1 FL=1
MRSWKCAYIVIAGLLLLMAPASALVPDGVEISTSSEWLTAGSGDTATIVVLVTSGSTPIPGAAVAFAVEGAPGSISPAVITTNDAGRATTVFSPATTSGTATITATVSHEELAGPLTRSVDQQIDHAAPAAITGLWYDPVVTAGGTTNITVRMADRYGNVVDSRNMAETVRLMVGAPAGFMVGEACTDDISVPVDAGGNATATLRVDTVAGENLVWIQPPVPIKNNYISITSVGGELSDIILTVDPVGASVPADGEKVIEITYTLFDGCGNPTSGQPLWVNASIRRGERSGEQQDVLLYSNRYGQVMITYGPEDSVGVATITATAAANASVSASQEVEFTSTDPVNMLLSANPQAMPSRDVKPDAVSQIRAKVMDLKGNPVEGETVMFEIISSSYAPYNQTAVPALEKLSAITNADGSAIVKFYPGTFTTDGDAPGWSKAATGTATVRATWDGVSRDILLVWKNYPYLSVETEVAPETVAVNETVDVTIRLKGDGWALQPDPIDVVFCTDRSGSMLKDYPDRMVKAMEASEIFNARMNYPRDRLGLVSFGKNGYTDLIGYGYRYWLGQDNTYDDDYSYRAAYYPSDRKYYANYATVDLPMSDDPSKINTTIEQTVPDWGTPMRSGIYRAINELNVNGSADAVKAVIVLSDGDYNHYGDPLARGSAKSSKDPADFTDRTTEYFPFDGLGSGKMSNQNMSVFAMSNDIRIYSIAFANDISDEGKRTLKVLAESTGGKYYYAPTGDDLAGVYTDIAGILKTEASVDTELDVIFENVEVNEAPVSGADVLDYIYAAGASTTISSWIDNETGHYDTIPFTTIDQTADWNTGNNLHFDIGTVRLGQTWEATFRLKVLTDGNINVFGPNSMITFNNGTDSLELPDTFITAIPDLNNTGITNRWLAAALDDPELPEGQDAFTDTVPLTWTLTYNGTRDIDQALAYSNDNGRSWTVFWTKTVDRTAEPGETLMGETLMDVRNLAPGDYLIRLVASTLDTPEAMDIIDAPICIGNASRHYIQIG